MTDGGGPVSWRRRSFAILSLLAVAAVVVELVDFFIRNAGYLLAGLIGLVLSAAGGWWVVTRRGFRRMLAAVGLLAGVGIMITVFVRAAMGADRPLVQVLVFAVLLAVGFGSAQRALATDDRRLDDHHRLAVGPPRHPVLLCNPWSGGGKVGRFGLVDLAEKLGIETVMLAEGLDLEQLARDAVARGADCLGMAGGDGSQALVASIAVEHELPFVCVTAGTRNHFALDLGLDREDPRHSLYAFTDSIERRIDYATVNGRFFVNNVSLGVYATIVQQDQYRDAKVETSAALLPELLGSTDVPFDLQFTDPSDTEVEGSYLIQVSNNPYVLDPAPDLSQRRSMDSGVLGVFAVTGASGAEAAAITALSAIGQRRRSPNWHEFTVENFEVRSRSGKAFAGVDGEALELETPLRFEVHHDGLRLLVPAGNLAVAEQRRMRQARLRDLVSVARGTAPRIGLN
jgi:diacylglycerol kinase family enzyme